MPLLRDFPILLMLISRLYVISFRTSSVSARLLSQSSSKSISRHIRYSNHLIVNNYHTYLRSRKQPLQLYCQQQSEFTTDKSNNNSSNTNIPSTSILQGMKIEQAIDDEDDHDQQTPPSSSNSSIRVKKVRQHANPLTIQHQIPLQLSPNWITEAFPANPHLPLHIDIGCGKGTWTRELAQSSTQILNVLGLEIRKPVAELAQARKEMYNINNLQYFASNVNIDLKNILYSLITLHNLPIQGISIQFPDPQFKKKHIKRRVINPDFVDMLASQLPPACSSQPIDSQAELMQPKRTIDQIGQNQAKATYIWLQSDISEVILDMIVHFLASPYFAVVDKQAALQLGHAGSINYAVDQLEKNPSFFPGLLTEREVATQKKGLPIYRILLYRNHLPYIVEQDQQLQQLGQQEHGQQDLKLSAEDVAAANAKKMMDNWQMKQQRRTEKAAQKQSSLKEENRTKKDS